MENFNEIYAEALLYAKKCISKGGSNFSPEELISEGYILCEGEVTLDILKKNISKFLNHIKYEKVNNSPFINIHHGITERVCTECHQLFPIDFFKKNQNKAQNFFYHSNFCKNCMNRKAHERGYIKRTLAKCKDKRNERARKEREEIADHYIKYSVLRNPNASQEQITKTRWSILEKRRKRKGIFRGGL